MRSYCGIHRWFRAALGALAIPAGLLVTWKSAQWTLIGIRNVLKLPDTGGHWLEFLMFDLLGFGLSLLGAATAATNAYALVATRLWGRRFEDLPRRSRAITYIAFFTATIIILILAGFGLLALLNMLLVRFPLVH